MNKYLAFFLKCIAASLPLLLLAAFTGLFPLAYMDGEYPSWRYTKRVQTGREKIDGFDASKACLILGDSRAMADLIPDKLGADTCNLAVGGATSIEMYYTLRHYIENYGRPESVIIMFAPFHYSYMDNFWTRTVYFNHLTLPEAFKVYREGLRLGSVTVSEREKGLSGIISMYLKLPDSYMPALINSRFIGRYAENSEKYRDLSEQRGHGLFGTGNGSSDLNYESNYTELDTTGDFGLLYLYTTRLLELCRDNNIRTILAQPPMNEASYKELNDDYIGQYTRLIESLSDIYAGAVISPEIPCYDNSLFGDSSHLNERGARIFTEEFKNEYDL
ncbi:MAG TPA: hypothetical protein DCL38_10110 [Lachnospiraceae bacterium]|nr:hypothetical protein [Lachnospiraceae bacterium]